MSDERRNRGFGGPHVREAKPSAPLPPFDRRRVGGIFAEGSRCACGSTKGLLFITVCRTEQDEEGGWREVTTAAWRCKDCRQLGFGAFDPSHER